MRTASGTRAVIGVSEFCGVSGAFRWILSGHFDAYRRFPFFAFTVTTRDELEAVAGDPNVRVVLSDADFFAAAP